MTLPPTSMPSGGGRKRERAKADASRYTPNTAEWVSLNRSPSYKVLDILDVSRHSDVDCRPYSAQPLLGTAGNVHQRMLHTAAWQRTTGSNTENECRSPSRKRGHPDMTRQQRKQTQMKYNPVMHSLPSAGGGKDPIEVARAEGSLRRATGGADTANGSHRVGRVLEGSHQQHQGGAAHNVFPRWLLREGEFRQLAHAELAVLKIRREEAAAWIKQELGASPSVMFGEDIAWYAEGVVDHHINTGTGREEHRQQGSPGGDRSRRNIVTARTSLRGGRAVGWAGAAGNSGGGRSNTRAGIGGKFLPNALPAAYRSTGAATKKLNTQTGSGWEFTVSDVKLTRSGTGGEAVTALGTKSGINLLDRFDDSMVDYLSAEVLLQQAFLIRSSTLGVHHPQSKAAALRLLQVYDAQQGGRREEAEELRTDPQLHCRNVQLRITELERAVGAIRTLRGHESNRTKPRDEQGYAKDVAERWTRPATERARRRIREREQREGFDDEIFKEWDGVGCSQGSNRGNVFVHVRGELSRDAEQGIGGQLCDGVGGGFEGIDTNGVGLEQERLWQTTARLDPESMSSTFHDDGGFDSEEAVKRATVSLKRQDFLLAARSSMSSLVQDVRNPQALQVLQESIRHLRSFPRQVDFRAFVEISLGPAASGILGERFTVTYSYHHRDKPDHPHSVEDWVGLFFLLDDDGDGTDDNDPICSSDRGESTDGHTQQDRQKHVRSRAIQSATCEKGIRGEGSTEEGKATADGTGEAGGTGGRMATMVGWRTLPPANEGTVMVGEGIITIEGSYLVRYFVGGSGCYMAESKPFKIGMALVDLKLVASDTTAINSGKPNPDGFLELECGAPLVVEYRFNSDTAIPKGDWLGVVAWGEEATADASVARTPLPEVNAGTVRFEEGPSLPGKYAVHAFLAESNDAVAGSTGMFQCAFAFDSELARRKRREFTLYLSTRWDMLREREVFRIGAAPALKQILDTRGVSFGYVDVRNDISVEELQTPTGVDAVLDGISRCRPYLVCFLGDLNDLELGVHSVDASILRQNSWMKNIFPIESAGDSPRAHDDPVTTVAKGREGEACMPAVGRLTVTEIEVISAFLLPLLQEAIEAESGYDNATRKPRLAAVPGGSHRHVNIIEALAEFRKWRSRADDGGDDSGASASYTRDARTAVVDKDESATSKTLRSALSPGLAKQSVRSRHGFFYTRAASLRSELHPSQKQGLGGIAEIISFINESKSRMTQLKQELAASTNHFRHGYQDENALLPMVLEDLSRAINKMYPLRTVPSRLDDASLRPHVLAGHLAERATVQLPAVRYRGFRSEALTSTSTGASNNAALASSKVPTATANASAAWRLQQRREFLPFEERAKRVLLEEGQGTHRGGNAGRETAGSIVEAGEEMVGGKVTTADAGDVAAEDRQRSIKAGSPRRNGLSVLRGIAGAGRSIGVRERNENAVTNTSRSSGDGAAGTAKRLPVVLADYLGDTSTIGMALVHQPGTGMTTALLGFLEWYCRGDASGGRQGVRVVETVDSIPQYGRCFLSRAVVIRPRRVSRDLDDGGLTHETIQRRTLVLRVDCRDPCHERLDKARLVHHIICEIVRTFGIAHKMPDRPGLSSGLETTSLNSSSYLASSTPDQDEDDSVNCGDTADHSSQSALGGAEGGAAGGDSATEQHRAWSASAQVAGGGSGGGAGGDSEKPGTRAGGAPVTGAIGGKSGHHNKLLEIGPDILGRWLDIVALHGDLVLVIENPEMLISAEERAAAVNNPETVPNPLVWLPPDLPPHVKVITTVTQGSSCQEVLCGPKGWGWHFIRRKAGLDAETKAQVIDAVCRRHGVGCMLDWVESDIVLKEKTSNIQFLVGIVEALCCNGWLARSGLSPGLHKARQTKPLLSPSSVSSPSNARDCEGEDVGVRGGGDGGAGDGRGVMMSDDDVMALREAAAELMQGDSALDMTRLRIRRLLLVKGRRARLLRASLSLVRLSSGGLSPYELTRALRHILESQNKNRRDFHPHNRQQQPTAVAHGGFSKGGASVRISSGRATGVVGAINPPPPTTPPTATAVTTSSHKAATAVNDSHDDRKSTPASLAEHAAQSKSGSSPHMAASTDNRSGGSNNTRETSSSAEDATTAGSNPTTAISSQDVHTGQDPDRSADGGSHPDDRRVRFNETGDVNSVQHTSPSANDPGGAAATDTPAVAQTSGRMCGSGSSTRLTDRGKERPATSAVTTASSVDGNSTSKVERQLFSEQDWRVLEPDIMRFCHKVFGRLVLRGAMEMTAIDHELINQNPELPEDKFVSRHGTQTASGGVAGGNAGSSLIESNRVSHFYLQVLAESFAKDLPSARRAEEQLSALAAIVCLSTQAGAEGPRWAPRPHREKLFLALADVELLYAMHCNTRGDPQAYLEYIHLAQVFTAPRRFITAVRASFEQYYNVAREREPHFHGRRQPRAPPDQLMYSLDSVRIAQPTSSAGSGSDSNNVGGMSGRGLSSSFNRRRQHHRPPPPSPGLMKTGPLRLLEAARLLLERFGEAEEAMNLAESAFAIMFGVRELTDEAFSRVTEVTFPVENITDCLRLLAGIYVSRGQDMHLLLFHEMAQTDSFGSTANYINAHGTHLHEQSPNTGDEENDQGRQGDYRSLGGVGSRPCSAANSQADRGGGGTSSSTRSPSSSTVGGNGRFATAGRVREFRIVLKGAAAHASKMKTAHAKRELNFEGLVKGHDLEAGVLNKPSTPGIQSKQQMGRLAKAGEAVDSMLKRWPVVIERMGICTEQAVKIRNLIKAVGVSTLGNANNDATGPGGPLPEARACEELRAAREHARLVEQHAEILVLSLRFERVALAIQRRQEGRELHRQAALGLLPPGATIKHRRPPSTLLQGHRALL